MVPKVPTTIACSLGGWKWPFGSLSESALQFHGNVYIMPQGRLRCKLVRENPCQHVGFHGASCFLSWHFVQPCFVSIAPSSCKARQDFAATQFPSQPSSSRREDLLQQWISPGATLYVSLGRAWLHVLVLAGFLRALRCFFSSLRCLVWVDGKIIGFDVSSIETGRP